MVRESSLIHKRTGKRSVSGPVERGSADIYRLAGLSTILRIVDS